MAVYYLIKSRNKTNSQLGQKKAKRK